MMLASASVLTLAPTIARADQSHDDDDDKPTRSAKTPRRQSALPVKANGAPPVRKDDVDDDDARPAQPAPAAPAVTPGAPAAPTADVVTRSPAATAASRRDDDDDDGPAPVGEIVVSARRLDEARAAVEPSLGASTYTLTNDAVENRPGGETTSLNQILLQAPGVTLSGNGPLQVRAQGDLQYRINNVIVPDGLSDLGDSLSTRLVDRVQLVAGALPAQYGLHAGGVVDITTKSGVYDRGGQAELYGGSQSEIEPAFEYGGAFGRTNLFVSGSYRHNAAGLLAPNGNANPVHDRTDQFEGFAYLDRIVDDRTRVSLIVGTSNERFELPMAPGDPALLGTQTQNSDYALASVLRTADDLTLQASAFARYSRLNTVDDRVAPGLFQSADTTSLTGGLQLEGVYAASPQHTLRMGTVVSFDGGSTRSTVLAKDTRSSDHRTIATVFLQDEWHPVGGLVINGGLRYDHASGTGGGNRLSPRMNLVWSSSGGIDVHAGYARYFVPAPQMETTLVAAGAVTSVNDLRPETDDYYDIGVQRTRGGLTLGIDGYIRRARNLLADVPLGLGSRQQFYNFARGRSMGVEFTMTYSDGPFAAWSNLSISRTEGRDIVSSRALFPETYLADVAAHYVPIDQDQTVTASGGVSYRLGRLHLSSDMTYGSGVRATRPGGAVNGATLPDYVQVNFAGVLHLPGLGGKPVDLRLDLVNAFDMRYRLRDGTALGGGLPLFARRRGVFLGVEQSF